MKARWMPTGIRSLSIPSTGRVCCGRTMIAVLENGQQEDGLSAFPALTAIWAEVISPSDRLLLLRRPPL